MQSYWKVIGKSKAVAVRHGLCKSPLNLGVLRE